MRAVEIIGEVVTKMHVAATANYDFSIAPMLPLVSSVFDLLCMCVYMCSA